LGFTKKCDAPLQRICTSFPLPAIFMAQPPLNVNIST